MEWASRSVPGAERLEEWEQLIADFYATRPAAGLCQFSRRVFEQSRLRRLIDLHPPLPRIVLHRPRRAVRRLFEILGERGQAVELMA
jgi:hypothetical protein